MSALRTSAVAAPTPSVAAVSTLRRAPIAARGYVAVLAGCALALPLVLRDAGLHQPRYPAGVTLLVLVSLFVLNTEAGRWVEGGMSHAQRPHKGLSAWAFACALLLPTPYLFVVVPLSYAYTRWRGMRVPLWKWVGSANLVLVAGAASSAVTQLFMDQEANLMDGDGRRGLLAIAVAAAVFLVLEAALLAGIAYLNEAEDEAWLRGTLAGRAFYLTEGAVLLMGGLTAAVWCAGPWFLFLLVPVYVLAQRAVLAEPLRERARTDEKTGLLRYDSWLAAATAEKQRCQESGLSWSVLFADLDHFKHYNDTHGHLAGDEALADVADEIRGQLRPGDLVGRFGGEEFCVFLPRAGHRVAGEVGERLRQAVERRVLSGTGVSITVSVGAVSVEAGRQVPIVDVLDSADRALMQAKADGRNRLQAALLSRD